MTTTQCTCTGCAVQQGTHQPAEALHQQIDEPQAEAMRLADECDESATHWVHEIDTRLKAAKMLRAQHARIEDIEAQRCEELRAYEITVANRDARIAELESQLEAIGAGGVEPLRKQVAQAVHQIAEPAAPVGKPIKDAIDALVWAAFTEGGCSEHRMSEARIQTELRKKELCTLIAATQPAAQGMDAQTAYEAECFRWLRDKALDVWKKGPVVFMTDADGCPGSGGELTNNILTGKKLEQAIPVAAQAKQGGAANG